MTFGALRLALRNFALRFRPYPEDQAAQVLAVHDGDTITVTSLGVPFKVRLCGIDAPELAQKPTGPEARVALCGLLGIDPNASRPDPVEVNLIFDRRLKEKWGRTLAWVECGGIIVNYSLVARGFAFAYLLKPNLRFADQIRTAENWAKDQKMGVWDPALGPITFPWDWRESHPFHPRFTDPRRARVDLRL